MFKKQGAGQFGWREKESEKQRRGKDGEGPVLGEALRRDKDVMRGLRHGSDDMVSDLLVDLEYKKDQQ